MNAKNLVIAALAAVALAACSDSSGRVKVNASAESGPAPTATALDLGNGIVLDRVAMVVREVELEGGDAGRACAGEDDGHRPGDGLVSEDGSSSGDADDCDHGLEFGPFLVDLRGAELASGIHWQFNVVVPTGTYREIELKVNTIAPGRPWDDPGLRELAGLHASIAIWGTIDGAPFLFTTPMAVEHEQEGTLVVEEETGPVLDFGVDPAGWFTSRSGARLDPNDSTARGEILANLRASLRLDRDDDEDGCDDASGCEGPLVP